MSVDVFTGMSREQADNIKTSMKAVSEFIQLLRQFPGEEMPAEVSIMVSHSADVAAEHMVCIAGYLTGCSRSEMEDQLHERPLVRQQPDDAVDEIVQEILKMVSASGQGGEA